MTSTLIDVETPQGPGRVHVFGAGSRATLVLGHGAGGGIGAPDLQLLAAELPGDGFTVCLVEQPWRVAGRRIAGRPPTLDAAWVPIVAAVRPAGPAGGALPPGPLIVGGRSAGARVACRTAQTVGAVGVLALSFPLHPPGRPERSRAEELRAPLDHGIGVRVVQGSTDPWGTPAEVAAELPDAAYVREVAGAHSFTRRPLDVLAAARAALTELLA